MINFLIQLITGCHDPVAWRFKRRNKLHSHMKKINRHPAGNSKN